MNQETEQLSEILKRSTEEINKANSGKAPVSYAPAMPKGEVGLGEAYAKRAREAAATTAAAIEAQAEERLQIALSQVEEAKAHVDRAKELANGVRARGEEEAQRAIATAQRLHDSDEILATIRRRFDDEDGRVLAADADRGAPRRAQPAAGGEQASAGRKQRD